MTALGKTLVFFVLLFSVITGGMVAMSYVTRTNWKIGYDKAQTELKVLETAQTAERRQFVDKRAQLEAEIKKLEKDLADKNTELLGKTTELANVEKQRSDQEKRAQTEATNNSSATVQNQALSLERNQMRDQNTELRGRVLKLETDIVKYLNDKTQAEILARRVQDENQGLMLQLEKKNNQLAELKARGIQLPSGALKAPPPEVKGTVTGVEGSIAMTSLGKDHGVNVGDELQVYRTSPAAEYLGKLRITISREHDSVGNFMPDNRTKTIKKGDTVDTKVLRSNFN